jgi:hypothetical protein
MPDAQRCNGVDGNWKKNGLAICAHMGRGRWTVSLVMLRRPIAVVSAVSNLVKHVFFDACAEV